MARVFLGLCVWFAAVNWALAEAPVKIERVSGGAILKSSDGKLLALYGILCESTTSIRGGEAKAFTAERVLGKPVTIVVVKELAGLPYVKVSTAGGEDLSRALLEAGLATWDRSLWPDLKEFEGLEAKGAEAYALKKKDAEEKGEQERMHVREEMEKAESSRQAAIDATKWEAEVEAWKKTAPEERRKARAELLERKAALDKKFSTSAKYFDLISYADSLLAQHQEAYEAIRSDYAERLQRANRSLGTELGLRDMEWERFRADQTVDQWVAEYNRIAGELDVEYPLYERDAQRVTLLDESLSKEVLAKEQPDPVPSEVEGASFGTGFLIAPETLLTCEHVVSGASSIVVRVTTGTALEAKVVRSDEKNDWCVLSVPGLNGEPIPRAAQPVKLGSTVYNMGFPLAGALGDGEPIVGKGDVASLAGLGGDPRHIQVTFPVNGGSSGSPVFDDTGALVGMVTHKYRDEAMLKATGTTAQGINYALKLDLILSKSRVDSTVQQDKTKKTLEEVAKQYRRAIFLLVAE